MKCISVPLPTMLWSLFMGLNKLLILNRHFDHLYKYKEVMFFYSYWKQLNTWWLCYRNIIFYLSVTNYIFDQYCFNAGTPSATGCPTLIQHYVGVTCSDTTVIIGMNSGEPIIHLTMRITSKSRFESILRTFVYNHLVVHHSSHDTLTQCWLVVGLAWQTVDQH